MRFASVQLYIAAVFVVITAQTAQAADSWPPVFYFTNETAITNGHLVISAVRSGDDKSKANVKALVGSLVVFVGGGTVRQGANLTVSSNILIEVEILPPRDVRPHAAGWNAEVLGILKSVDFEKRTIYIRAKPEDWKEDLAF